LKKDKLNLDCMPMKNDHVKNLYIHVGMSKTGTSTIQDTLYANRDFLLKADCFYSNYLPKNHSDVFRMLFASEPEKQHTNVKLGIGKDEVKTLNLKNIEVIEKELSTTNCSNIIYSGESISILSESELKNLRGFFEQLLPAAKIFVVVSTRNPIDFITSFVQQRKRTSIGSDFEFSYALMFNKLISVFGRSNVLAYKFEDACMDEGGPACYFLRQLGFSNSVVTGLKVVNSNSSISDKAIDIIDYINNRLPMLGDGRISDGRMHLDYVHFYDLTGNKFILGKDFFQEHVDMSSLSRKCLWLKTNLGIDYDLTEIPDAPPEIIYDEVFFKEIVALYPFITPVLQKITFDYVKARRNSTCESRESTKNLDDLVAFISSQFPLVLDDLTEVIKFQKEITTSDTKHRNQLLKRFKGDDIRAGQFLRDVALFLEHYDMLEQSKFFMSKAKMYAPNNKQIDQKLAVYYAED